MSSQVNCVTSIDIIKLGELDSSSDTPYLKKGSKIDLPLWLIKNYREKVECYTAHVVDVSISVCNASVCYKPYYLFSQRFLIVLITLQTEEDVFEVNPPKFLSASYNEVLQADSTVINLQSWSTYFFSFALTYLSLFPDQSMAEVILKVSPLYSAVYLERIIEIFSLPIQFAELSLKIEWQLL